MTVRTGAGLAVNYIVAGLVTGWANVFNLSKRNRTYKQKRK